MSAAVTKPSMRWARLVCATCALGLVVPVLWPQASAPAGHAAEAEAFNPGYGDARGSGVRVGPSRSGFNFTTDFAISLADYQNTVARGDSRGISLGTILETAIEAVDEEGEAIPERLRVDSRDEGAEDGISRSEYGTPEESPFYGALGSQYVRATDDPLAEVETILGTLGLDGAVAVEGVSTRALTGVVDAGQREARGEAVVERIVLGDGQVVLEGLEWTAVHRTGAEEEATASFSLGGVEIADNALPPSEVGEPVAAGASEGLAGANEALAETGLSLEPPEKVVNEDTGEVAMTPLRIALGPSEASREIFGPFMDAFQPVREPLAEGLIEADESFGAVFLLFDVGMGAFAGGGELLFEVGGARALTGAREFEDPFGDVGDLGGFGEVPEESASSQPRSPGETTGDEGGDGGSPTSSTDAPSSGTSSTPTAEDPAGDETQEPAEPVTSEAPDTGGRQDEERVAAPAASRGAGGGQAVLASLVALLVAGGFGGADFLRLRKSQRTIPT